MNNNPELIKVNVSPDERGEITHCNDFNFQKDGLYIKNTNNITEKRFNKEFQGWGFTFF